MCTENKIKTMKGDAADCDDDPACDGVSEIPNAVHTACGENMLSEAIPAFISIN